MSNSVRRMALLALCVSAWCVCASSVTAAPPRVLFPKNLHLTRQVQEPLSGTTTTFEEYCSGNRVVSVSGDKTVIADYDRQEITEIDRHAGTYSVSRFDEVANVGAEGGSKLTAESARGISSEGVKRDRWTATPRGVRGAAGRSVDQFEFAEAGQDGRKVEVGIDRGVVLSEEAVEVLIGAAYPNPRRDEHEPLLRAAGSRDATRVTTNSAEAAPQDAAYGLPVTQAFTYTDSGSSVTFRTTVTRVGAEAPPAEVLMIPPDAKRVESHAASVRRQLRELDHPSTATQQQ
jgi:hypothetical protein